MNIYVVVIWIKNKEEEIKFHMHLHQRKQCVRCFFCFIIVLSIILFLLCVCILCMPWRSQFNSLRIGKGDSIRLSVLFYFFSCFFFFFIFFCCRLECLLKFCSPFRMFAKNKFVHIDRGYVYERPEVAIVASAKGKSNHKFRAVWNDNRVKWILHR